MARRRILAVVLAGGSIAWTASDPARFVLSAGACRIVFSSPPPLAGARDDWRIEWGGCESLVREALTVGSLLLIGITPQGER